MPKPLTKIERAMFQAFTADYPFCWACGIPANPTWVEAIHATIDYPRNLERAHIIGGAGRVHDRRNLAMLCKLCHGAAHHERIRIGDGVTSGTAVYLPNLYLEHLLWLQFRLEGRVDRRFLRPLRGQALPNISQVPHWFRVSFQHWQGCDHKTWKTNQPKVA